MAFKDRLYEMPVVGTALRVQDRYKADAGDQFAGAIGFFGFLSLFPLLILALSTVGFVLADAEDEEIREVADSIQQAIPGFSGALGGGGGDTDAEGTGGDAATEGDAAADPDADDEAGGSGASDEDTGVAAALDGIIRNRGSVGLIGLVTLLLSGLRVINSAQTATLVIFRVDLLALSGLKRKVQQILALVLLGLLALGGVVASGSLGVFERIELFGIMEVLAPVLAWVGTYVLDVGLFLAAYKLLATVDGPPWRRLVPGALFAGLGWTLLKGFGATYVSDQAASAGELYGALGGVIGLLLLMYLAGRLFVYGAELSAVWAPDPERPAALADDTDVAGVRTHVARSAARPGDGTLDHRQALGFAIGLGALAGLLGALRPWDSE